MNGQLLLLLLLTTGVALANNKPRAEHDAGAAVTQVNIEATQGQAEQVQDKTEKKQQQSKPAQSETRAKTEKGQGQSKTAQPETQTKTEEAQDSKINREQAEGKESAKLASVPGGTALGMSILGNREAPKALVIVSWKGSELGASPGFSVLLDDSRQPVDKEVFMRALRYYELRSGKKP